MPDRILTLCYHAIRDLSGDPILSQYGIDRKVFESQLDLLGARGFHFVTPDDVLGLLSRRSMQLPDQAVLLTFDDCYEELVEVARDILKPRNIKAIAFAVSGMTSGTNEWDQRIGAGTLGLLDPEGLRELSALGVEIGCHSRTHRYLPTLADHELQQETVIAAAELERLGLPRPRFFAFPHGEHDSRSRGAVRKAGFDAAFGLSRRRVSASSNRFALPRIEILARDQGWRFRVKSRWPRSAVLFSPTPLPRRFANALAGALKHLRPSRSRQA